MTTETGSPREKTLIDCHVPLAVLPDSANGCFISPKLLKCPFFRFLLWKQELSPAHPREASQRYLHHLITELRASKHVQMAVLLGMALVGAGLGATLAHSAWVQWRGSDPGTLVVLFFAAVGAALAVTLQRVIVIAATAFLGAQTVVAGVLALLSRQPARRGLEGDWLGHLGVPAFGRQWTFLAWVLLGLVGTVVQLRSGGGKRVSRRK